MHTEDPKQSDLTSDDAPGRTRAGFDIRELESMREDEADAEWLRQPEAWHMH